MQPSMHCFAWGVPLQRLKIWPSPICTRIREVAHSVSHLIPKEPYLTLSIGGRDADRSYRHWPAFLHLLDESTSVKFPNIVLLGSVNGQEMEERIDQEHLQKSAHHPSRPNEPAAISRNDLPIDRVHRLRRRPHACGAFDPDAPSVSLFRAQEPHHLWLTRSCHSSPIQSTSEDSAIAPGQILDQLSQLFNNGANAPNRQLHAKLAR